MGHKIFGSDDMDFRAVRFLRIILPDVFLRAAKRVAGNDVESADYSKLEAFRRNNETGLADKKEACRLPNGMWQVTEFQCALKPQERYESELLAYNSSKFDNLGLSSLLDSVAAPSPYEFIQKGSSVLLTTKLMEGALAEFDDGSRRGQAGHISRVVRQPA
jgi:hypothetical protein